MKKEETINTEEQKSSGQTEPDNNGQQTENTVREEQEDQEQGASAAEQGTEQKIRELEEEVSELKDQLLRKQADFENFRKRMLREKEEAISYANRALLQDLLTVIDDFERAIDSAQDSRDFDAFHNGVALIERQLTSMLERKWGLVRFDSKDQAFDPNRHQAIASEEKEGIDTPIVVEDYQKGYLLHERVLRPARVKVAQPLITPEQDNDAETQGE